MRSSEQLVSYNDADGDGALSADELRQATEASTYQGQDGDAENVNTLVGVADADKDGKVSSEFSALAAQERLSPFFAQNDSEAMSRILLTRLLQSTFTQLRGDFVAPSRNRRHGLIPPPPTRNRGSPRNHVRPDRTSETCADLRLSE